MLLLKIQWPYKCGSFFCSVPLICALILLQIPHYLDYYSFEVLKTGRIKSANFVLFKIALDILDLLHFHVYFKIITIISALWNCFTTATASMGCFFFSITEEIFGHNFSPVLLLSSVAFVVFVHSFCWSSPFFLMFICSCCVGSFFMNHHWRRDRVVFQTNCVCVCMCFVFFLDQTMSL